MTLPISQTVDLGHGRGRAAPAAAASIFRIDAQLGRPADINEAWRSPAKADANYAAWIAYQNGGPKAPYALPASKSVHCLGMAADSDDWYSAAAAAVWRDNGWRQTARYPGTSKDEPWHGEYFAQYDNHRNDTASSGAKPLPTSEAAQIVQEDDMPTLISSAGGQSLAIEGVIVPLTTAEEVQSIKITPGLLECARSVHERIQILVGANRSQSAALPVRVFVKDGNGTVYVFKDGGLAPLVDPNTLAALEAAGGPSITISQAEATNLLNS